MDLTSIMRDFSFIIQKIDNFQPSEQRVVKHYCLLNESVCVSLSYAELSNNFDYLNRGFVPVGSVEFVKKAFTMLGITHVQNISYPEELKSYLKREVYKTTIENAPIDKFIKPVETKLFTGFINTVDNERPQDFLSLPLSTDIWVSDIIEIVEEYRIYVNTGKIVGYSRYDSNPQGCEILDSIYLYEVEKMITSYSSAPIGYSIDIGITKNKDVVLIECNDGWSLGYYPSKTLTKENYINLIATRWNQIFENNLKQRQS